MNNKTKEFIKNHLRRSFLQSKLRNDVMKRGRVEIPNLKKDGTPSKQKRYKHRCNQCGELFDSHEVEVDHKEEIGEWVDWNNFVERLFCKESNLQKLCCSCHSTKTASFNRWKDSLHFL